MCYVEAYVCLWAAYVPRFVLMCVCALCVCAVCVSERLLVMVQKFSVGFSSASSPYFRISVLGTLYFVSPGVSGGIYCKRYMQCPIFLFLFFCKKDFLIALLQITELTHLGHAYQRKSGHCWNTNWFKYDFIFIQPSFSRHFDYYNRHSNSESILVKSLLQGLLCIILSYGTLYSIQRIAYALKWDFSCSATIVLWHGQNHNQIYVAPYFVVSKMLCHIHIWMEYVDMYVRSTCISYYCRSIFSALHFIELNHLTPFFLNQSSTLNLVLSV